MSATDVRDFSGDQNCASLIREQEFVTRQDLKRAAEEGRTMPERKIGALLPKRRGLTSRRFVEPYREDLGTAWDTISAFIMTGTWTRLDPGERFPSDFHSGRGQDSRYLSKKEFGIDFFLPLSF